MKLKHWLILSVVSLLLISCGATQNATNQESVEQTEPSSLTQSTDSGVPQPATGAEVLKSGSFVSGEHPTQGMVQLVRQGNQVTLVLDQSFTTSEMGPDLVVILHRSENVIGSTQPPAYPIREGDYVVLAPLQSYSGAQSYAIPDNINLADYKSAGIWCRKFNATFGAAVLQ
jgi:hypothetical protein